MSGATSPNPPIDVTRRNLAALIVALVVYALYLAGVFGDVGWAWRPSFHLPSTAIDWLVRNQRLLVVALGVIAAGIVLWVAVRKGRVRQAVSAVAPTAAGSLSAAVYGLAVADVGHTLVSVALAPPLMGFTTVIAAIGLGTATAATTGVVANDIGLELPALTRESTVSLDDRTLVIFIHGWNGDRNGTWRGFPDLVAQDPRFASFDVWSLGYPTYMRQRQLSVAGVANFFIVQFVDVFDIFHRYRRVLIVAHSMGGLIAREVAIQAALRGQPRVIDQLIEIGVPHEGARPADLTDALGISEALTGDMRASSDFLRDLKTHWATLTPKPATFCVTSPQDRVVPPASATAQCADQTSYLNGSHTDIVKPTTMRDVRYTVPTSRFLPPAATRTP